MKLATFYLAAEIICAFFSSPSSAWWSRRRRSCSAVYCRVGNWQVWSTCSRTCGGGIQTRKRSKTRTESCGGGCAYHLIETANCNTNCCPVNCVYSWSLWSSCVGCGNSTQSRSPSVTRRNSCNGTLCPAGGQNRTCDTGVCCPVNCVVNAWSSWGSCNAACERSGQQVRTRTVKTTPLCKGTPCPTLRESKSCQGPCCPRNCQVSSWTPWGACSAPSGKCGPSDGTRSRTRRKVSNPSCGGRACPSLTETARCRPVPIPCKMSPWSRWSTCSANNGKCGAGTQYRTRTVATNPYCSPQCPSLRKQSRGCTHSCCPVNCAVSSWNSWTACSSTCGSGTKTRGRKVTRQAFCGGTACPSLKETVACTKYNNRDCVMSPWSLWSQCSNACGSGSSTRTRSVVRPAVCRGKACGPTTESRPCTDYRHNRDCVVSLWTSWGSCSAKCTVGSKQRTRTVKTAQRCRGKTCPALKETAQCGTVNNGCQHTCSNGICYCRAGYYLSSNKKSCIARDCKMPNPQYCAPGTKLGSTCKYALVRCPGGKTTYPITCSLSCPKYYSVKGTASITCQTSGQWSSYSTSYCRRNNDPPTQIILSGSGSISENKPSGTFVGRFSTVDSNSKDKHVYSIISGGGGGKFQLRGANLYSRTVFNYEAPSKRFSFVVRSTDNGIPAMKMDKTFTISVTDVNEAPTGVQLSSKTVNENSDVDTVVGMLSTVDPDNGQSYSYTLLDSAGGRFKIQRNFVKVAVSNRNCLANGGSQCVLDYEAASSHTIKVRSVDSGSPAKSIDSSFSIAVINVNDRPRDLNLSNYKVKENAPLNSKVGTLSATDQDKGQSLTFALVDDDGGRFTLDGRGGVLKAKATDYETSKVHHITAKATDNGNPVLSITKQFSIVVLNVNEAPVSITLSKKRIQENALPGTRVGTLSARDTDAVQNLVFKLDDDSGGQLSLAAANASCQSAQSAGTTCTTDLLVSGAINYEDASSLDIIVRVTDNNGLFRTERITLAVIDVNDPPTNVTLDGGTSASVAENSQDVQIAVLQTEDEDKGQRFSYVLTRNPGSNFELRGDKLFASPRANLNYESSTSYQISVRSTDNGSPPLFVEKALLINVQDVNEKPTDITLSRSTVAENQPQGTVIGQLTVSDPDSKQSHVCSLTESAGGAIGLSQNQLIVGSAGVNYEKSRSLTAKVSCRDPGGLTVQKAFVVIVRDVNERPTDIALSNTVVKENQKAGTLVGKLTVSDPDNAISQVQSFSFSLSSTDPNQPFQLQSGNLVTTRKLDFETNAQWTLQIEARDNGSRPLSRTQTFTIQVTDANDAPSGLLLSSAVVNENSDVNVLVGTLTSLDQDTSQSHKYQLLDSASGRFKVDGNELKVAVSNHACLSQGGSSCLLNYEAQKRHTIRVKTTDSGTPQLSYERNFTIDLRDVNDMPRRLRLSSNKVKENAAQNSLIGQFAASDEDASQSLSFSLTNDDSGRFKVDPQGKLYKAKAVDYETQQRHVIKAMVQDNGNPAMKMEKSFTVEVLDVNEAPIGINITSQGGQLPFAQGHAQVKENSPRDTVIGTVVAFDSDSVQSLTFRLDDDARGRFMLGSSVSSQTINIPGIKTKCSMSLRLNAALDYEDSTEHYVSLRVTDNKGLFATARFKISVVDQNDPPQNVTLAGRYTASVNENTNGALVGQLVTSDQDAAQTHTYKLLNDAAGRFVIQGDKLFVSSSANLDFETRNEFTVAIQCNDSGNPPLGLEQTFKIRVLDVNEAPANVTLTSANVKENSQSGTVIGRLDVSDPDNYGSSGRKQTHSCQVTGKRIGQFEIQANVLKVGTASLDYEQASVVHVQVKCTDDGSPPLPVVNVLSVIVDDVNEAPITITLSYDAIAENEPSSNIGVFSTADPDNANQAIDRQTFTYSLMGNTTGLPFAVDGDALNSTRSLDFEVQSSWQITVKSVDSGKPPLSVVSSFQITVTDINEEPYNILLTNNVTTENPAQDTLVGSLSCQDPDLAQSHTYTLLDGAGGRFTLQGNEIKVALSNDDCLEYGGSYCKLNYEKQRFYTLSVRATDNGVPPLNGEANLTISLTDINDRPRNFKLSSNAVKEDAPVGKRIGRFAATDEDELQTLKYALVDDDGGRFEVDSFGYLLKANGTDYETSKVHKIVAQVTDNGSSPLELNKTFVVVVVNVNEAPINSTLTSVNGQQTFPDNAPKVNENSDSNTTVGTLQALDHDAAQNLRFSLDDDAGGKFTVGSLVSCHNNTNVTGVKTVCTALLQVSGELNYETSPSEDIVIRVTDDNGLFHARQLQVMILDVNDSPSNITLAGEDTVFIDENLNDGLVGELATTDEDAGQAHSYILTNNGGWKFVLKNDKVYTSRFANLDFEKQSVYTIAVRSTDNGSPRRHLDKTFTVKVRDVNEPPMDITLFSSSVKENSPRGTVVGNLSVVDPDDKGPRGRWQNHSCSVVNSANTPFTVNSTSNAVVVAGDLNYEETRSYDAVVRCYDSGNPPLYFQKTLKIVILDVNEAPYDITLSNSEVSENAGIVAVGLLNTADPDNEQAVVQTFTYSIVGSAREVPFAVVGDNLTTTRSLDYEANDSWIFVIESTDSKGLSTTKNFTIIVKDINDPPTAITVSGPLQVDENTLAGEYIGAVTTADQDVGQTHHYEVIGVVASGYHSQSTSPSLLDLFSVESSSGRITLQKSGLDYEKYANYTVTVNSTDGGIPPYSVTGSFVVSVNNINEMPRNISLSANRVPENSPIGTVVGNLSVHDPDNVHVALQTFDCRVTSGLPFTITHHLTLTVAENSLDYESKKKYIVNISCTELLPSPLSIASSFNVTVQDVNEAPCNLTISSTTVKENGFPGELVGNLSVQDPDTQSSGKATVSLAIESQSPNLHAFQLIGRALVANKTLDFEAQSTYNVTIVATDSGEPPLKTNITVSIQVIDTNDRPTSIDFASGGVFENATVGTVVGRLRAKDQDIGQTHSFEVVSNSDVFKVNGSRLLVSDASLDYETAPVINVTLNATDSGSPAYSVQELVTINVLDSNDPPSDIIINSSFTVPENSPGGTLVASLIVVDEDADQVHRCVLSDGGKYFEVVERTESSSDIRVKQNASLDYENMANTSIGVSVECHDNGTPQYSVRRNVDVVVMNVNEAPFNISLDGSLVVEENAHVGYPVGNLTCQDPDVGQPHVFAVIGNYSSIFEVDSDTNVLKVKDPSYLDYEKLPPPALLTITIRATDVPGNASGPALDVTGKLIINIIDINEAPVDIRLVPENVTVPENASLGYCIARITSTNPERWQTVNYTLLNFQHVFAVEDKCANDSDGSWGKSGLPYLTVKSHLSYNNYSQGYALLVEAKDNGIVPQSFNGTVTVHVSKIDPCPTASCHVNAICTRIDWQQYSCSCREGYSGDGFNCTELNECEPNPCSHGGTCHDYVNAYNCTCPSGFHNGSDCLMIDFCESNPCQHGSTCNPDVNRYDCFCSDGYTGVHCETDIDDCVRVECIHGHCTDGVNRFTCECSDEGFYGPLCERSAEDCRPNRCERENICVPPFGNHKYSSGHGCFPVGLVVTLQLTGGTNTSDTYWQYQLRQFIIKELPIPFGEVTGNEDDSKSVSATDVFFLPATLERGLESRAKRSSEDETGARTDFMVFVQGSEEEKVLGVPVNTVLCGLNNTCQGIIKQGLGGDNMFSVCVAAEKQLEAKRVTSCLPQEAADLPLKDQTHSTLSSLYYVIAGIGGLLLVVILAGLLLCRRKTLNDRERKLIVKRRQLKANSETYTDIMYRHHQRHSEGAMNPIFGTGPEDADVPVVMLDNPIYKDPAKPKRKRSGQATGFDNPMYTTFKLEDDEEGGQQDSGEKNGGFSNPLFAKASEEEDEADSPNYAVPIKPAKPVGQQAASPVYDTPVQHDPTVSEEPQAIAASGVFNPLYQTCEEFSDITSVFASPRRPPVQTIDEDPGQSHC